MRERELRTERREAREGERGGEGEGEGERGQRGAERGSGLSGGRARTRCTSARAVGPKRATRRGTEARNASFSSCFSRRSLDAKGMTSTSAPNHVRLALRLTRGARAACRCYISDGEAYAPAFLNSTASQLFSNETIKQYSVVRLMESLVTSAKSTKVGSPARTWPSQRHSS
eukprot:scaffold160274_cov28-Tisochrysis_lutea.AAC.3